MFVSTISLLHLTGAAYKLDFAGTRYVFIGCDPICLIHCILFNLLVFVMYAFLSGFQCPRLSESYAGPARSEKAIVTV